jgi:hypothetical protein
MASIKTETVFQELVLELRCAISAILIGSAAMIQVIVFVQLEIGKAHKTLGCILAALQPTRRDDPCARPTPPSSTPPPPA